MKLEDFDYVLSKERIAQSPLAQRDSSKLLVIHRGPRSLTDRVFKDIVSLIPSGDCLVLNDTKVFPGKLLGKKDPSGGKADVLLIEPYSGPPPAELREHLSMGEIEEWAGKVIWRALIQPSMREGQKISFEGVEGRFIYLGRDGGGMCLVEYTGKEDVAAIAHRIGQMPLPPYIQREVEPGDAQTYQTVYARQEGAIAAPTAGLHFTEAILSELKAKGVEVLYVTLHVGYGTFKPVQDPENHRMHSEVFSVSKDTADRLNAARKKGREIWAVGTTTLRTLETCTRNAEVIAGEGKTDLFITPGFEFEMVDHLITNFHLPKTTLLMLTAAFMGEKLQKTAYAHAISHDYRFYSYGDAMVIV